MTILRNLGMAEYHQHAALSNSKINGYIANGAAWYKGRYIDRTIPGEETSALKLGKAFDTLVFEGESGFVRDFAVQPATYMGKDGEKPWHNGAAACKEWHAELARSGRQAVSSDEADMFNRMLESMRLNALVMDALGACEFQVSLRSRLAIGIELQARPDGLNLKGCEASGGKPYTLDLKTTADFGEWFDECDPSSPRACSPVWKFGYHRQGAIDNCLLKLEEVDSIHLLVVVEKQAPNRCGLVLVDNDSLELGWHQVERHMTRLADYITGRKPWPLNPPGIIVCAPPQWALDSEVREASA